MLGHDTGLCGDRMRRTEGGRAPRRREANWGRRASTVKARGGDGGGGPLEILYNIGIFFLSYTEPVCGHMDVCVDS